MNIDESKVREKIANAMNQLTDDELENFQSQIENLAIKMDLGQDARCIGFIGGKKDGLTLPVVCEKGIPTHSSMWRPIPMAWNRCEAVPCELYEYDIIRDAYVFQGKLDVRKI